MFPRVSEYQMDSKCHNVLFSLDQNSSDSLVVVAGNQANLVCCVCVSFLTRIFKLTQSSASTLSAALAKQEALTSAWLPFRERKKTTSHQAPRSLLLFSWGSSLAAPALMARTTRSDWHGAKELNNIWYQSQKGDTRAWRDTWNMPANFF